MIFADRRAAGKDLARALEQFRGRGPYALAIPRGGVVVAAEVARSLRCPLDVIVPRKLRAPYNPELAIGAVAHDGSVYLDPNLGDAMGASQEYVESEVRIQREEITRRLLMYRGRTDYDMVVGRTAILIDDGIATGSTMMAAVRALRKMAPQRLVMAVPVAPVESLRRLGEEVDEVVCLYTPATFYAVGQFYEDFAQTTDEEVIALLRTTSGPSTDAGDTKPHRSA